jgi:hypothetical protein
MRVIVYVRAADERALAAEGHDPAKWVREVVDRALSERGGAGPDRGAVIEMDDRRDTDEGRAALASRSLDVPRSESDAHFKPDPKPAKAEKRKR